MRSMLAVLLAALVLPSATAHAWDALGDDHAVPAAAAASSLFPSHDEVLAELADLEADPRLVLVDVGASEEGRALKLMIAADPPVASPADVGARVVTLLYSQQHGNEPAGTPAALATLRSLTGVFGDEVLRDQVVLVLPMANPDGAEAFTRENVDGTDTNRDHMNLTSATARVLHEVVAAWRPALVVDHHEYSGTGPGTGPVYFYDWDATILWPRHANVDPAVVDLSIAVNDAMRARLAEEGYTSGDYGTLTANGIPLQQLAGGPTPNIARNHYGMHHTASLLVESRVDPAELDDAFEGPTRRIAVHVLCMEAALRHMQANAAAARATREEAAAAAPEHDLAFDGGDAVPLPNWGWAVADAKAVRLLEGHGATHAGGRFVVTQPLVHHVGLLVDDASTWKVTTGIRIDEPPQFAPETGAAAAVPLPWALGVAALAGAMLVRRRA